jgi:hypothetical protein
MHLRTAILFVAVISAASLAEQIKIDAIEKMPNFPQPYQMRDWKKVAVELDKFIFDEKKSGEYLPVIWFDQRKHDFNEPTFALPAYIGHYAKNNNAWDNITCLGAVSSAALVGIDKTNQDGRNWVAMCQNYFGKSNGQLLYSNNVGGQTGSSFWYDLFPDILFYQIHYHYPGIGEMDSQFTTVADRLYQGCEAMGGKTEPYTVPDFNHTAFNFATMKPFDNGVWFEADAAAAVGWLEYNAHAKTGNKKYLTAAKWAMDYLQNSTANPYYECLMPHGVYTAARMNAQTGSTYDVGRFLTWCFDGTNWRKWGISQGKWGKYDCAGLCSSMNGEGYGFPMNTFNLAGNLVPVVRYDQRYARAIGKWMLNAANSSRLFYPNFLDEKHQTDWAWSHKYDLNSCIAYEGLQDVQKIFDRASTETLTTGRHVSGTLAQTCFVDDKFEVLGEDMKTGRLQHTWQIPLRSLKQQVLVVIGHCTGSGSYDFTYRIGNGGQWKKAFTMTGSTHKTLWTELPASRGDLFLQVDSNGTGELYVDDLYVRGTGSTAPYATGDPRDLGWGATDLGLYGSVFAGIFGGIIETTNVEGILKLDCLATDYYHDPAYPTFLYYNPYYTEKIVNVSVGEHTDIYDTVSNSFIARNVSGTAAVHIPADSAMVLVIAPSRGKIRSDGNVMYINDKAVNFRLQK